MQLCKNDFIKSKEFEGKEDICGNMIIDTVEIDGERFDIKYNRYNNEYISGYYLARDARSGTLIIEKTKDKTIKQLQKASKKRKIYA